MTSESPGEPFNFTAFPSRYKTQKPALGMNKRAYSRVKERMNTRDRNLSRLPTLDETLLVKHPVDGDSRDSSVGIAIDYGLDDRGVGVPVPVGSRIFSFPRRPNRLWGPSSFLSTGYRGLFPGG
jgi:hypothetical protein